MAEYIDRNGHTEEHKKKISESVKHSYGERREQG
jgi:uncharacterized protein (UPF0335 family)